MPFNTIAYPERSVNPIKYLINLDIVTILFKMTMKQDTRPTMRKLYNINPATWMWHGVDSNSFIYHLLLEFIKVAKISLIMVLGSP
jgi:predicted ATP-grasp superfamily ATP-dependent carboligase